MLHTLRVLGLKSFKLSTQHKKKQCHDSSFRLVTRARGCKVTGQEGSPGVMPHAPGSARECEGIGPHTPKGTPTLGVGISVDSQMFKEQLQGSKPNGLRSSLYH